MTVTIVVAQKMAGFADNIVLGDSLYFSRQANDGPQPQQAAKLEKLTSLENEDRRGLTINDFVIVAVLEGATEVIGWEL